MGNRTAKFISGLFASVLAGIPLSAVSQTTPSAPAATGAQNTSAAADDCLGGPKGAAPQGQHWYYRLERGTQRKCWYLRAESPKPAQSTQQAAAPEEKNDQPAPRSVQDAHAEFSTQQPPPAPETTASIPAPGAPVTPTAEIQGAPAASDIGATQPAVDARWPDPSNVAPAPAPQAAPAPKLADAPQPAPKAPASPSSTTTTLASAVAPAAKATGSLQMLLLVVGGALALAGVTGSIIYRFAGSRRARSDGGRRRVNWDHWEPATHENARAPWTEAATTVAAPRGQRPRLVDFADALATAARLGDVAAPHADRAEHDATEPKRAEITLAADVAEPQVAAVDAKEHNDLDADAVDVDAITAMLERLAKAGPRLKESSFEAGFADFAQIRRGQSAARA